MKLQRCIAMCFVAAFLLLPVMAGTAAAAESDTPKLIMLQNSVAANHYGYITVNSVGVDLTKGVDAEFTINYSIDPWIAFLVFLLGKQDLKNRLVKIINCPASGNAEPQEITFQYVDNEKAIISISNVGMNYGDNTYWYPEHQFAVTIPELVFHAPRFDKSFNNTNLVQKGFGYY